MTYTIARVVEPQPREVQESLRKDNLNFTQIEIILA